MINYANQLAILESTSYPGFQDGFGEGGRSRNQVAKTKTILHFYSLIALAEL